MIVIAALPLATCIIIWAADDGVSRGTILAAAACTVVQAILLLWLHSAAETTDSIARAAQKELKDAADTDFVAIFDDGLK